MCEHAAVIGPAWLSSFSPLSQPRWTHLATDGMPLALVTNSMYQPGGAMFGLVVTFSPMLLPLTVNGSATYRWSGSEECVTASGRISSADTMGESVVMFSVAP